MARTPTDDGASDTPLAERLVAATLRLLAERGPEAITLRAVAGAVGVSHMAPYRHFADKDALLAQVAVSGFERLSDAMAAAAGDEPHALERLRSFGRSYTVFAMEHPALYRLMFGPLLADKARHPGLERAGARAYAYCADTVGAVLALRGVDDPEERHAHAVATWSLVHGLSLLLLDGQVAPALASGGAGELVERVLALHGRVFR